MNQLARRVANRYAARSVHLDKRSIEHFVTHDLVPAIVSWVKRRPEDVPLGSNNIAEENLTIEAADGRSSLEVIVGVRSRPSNHKGTITLGGGFGKWRGRPAIVLELNGAYTPKELLSERVLQPLWSCTHESCLPYSLYSLIIHEATHAADSLFPGPPIDGLERGGEIPTSIDPVKYINNPSEVRAFMQQVVDEVPRYAKMPAIRERALTKPNPNQELIAFALRLSTTWKLIEQYLTPVNKAKILRAVYEYLDRMELLL